MDPVRENEGGREENVRQRGENEGCTRGREEWDRVREMGGGGGGGRKRQRNTSNYTLSVR